MKTYNIVVEWMMTGTFEVEAPSLEEAYRKVRMALPPCDTLPSKQEYLKESMRLNRELSSEVP